MSLWVLLATMTKTRFHWHWDVGINRDKDMIYIPTELAIMHLGNENFYGDGMERYCLYDLERV